jgi:MFS family permease
VTQQSVGTPLLLATVGMALAVQSLTSMAMLVPTVLAPVAAADLGVQASRIGVLVAFTYFSAIVSGLVCDTLIARYGPVRVFGFAVVLVSVGLVSGYGGHIALVFLLAACSGTAHGLVNPASSTVLLRASPPQYRSLIFSIKQTGVPLGSAIAGIALPLLLQIMHWREALLVLGGASVLVLAVVVPFRRIYDTERNPGQRFRLAAIGTPIVEVLSRPEVRRLALTSASYSAVQMSLFSYLMLFLIVDLGYSLVVAGLVFSVAQGAGVLSRPVWGVIADRFQVPRGLLAVLGIAMGLCGVAAAFFTRESSFALIVAVCALYGGSAIGWNGIYMAEVARLAPPGKVGLLTGGSLLFTFTGAVLGPPIFGAILGLTGSYKTSFAVFAALPLLAGMRLLVRRSAF